MEIPWCLRHHACAAAGGVSAAAAYAAVVQGVSPRVRGQNPVLFVNAARLADTQA
jgi:hypothetical protein